MAKAAATTRIAKTKALPKKKSVARAKEMGDPAKGPIMLLDHYDNCASGGTMDTTDTLREIIRQDLDNVVFFGIYDPEAVQQAIKAGVGAEITLTIGAKLPMPLMPVQSTRPLTLEVSRSGPVSRSHAAIGGGRTELADFKFDVSWSKYNAFIVTIDRVEQGRLAQQATGHLALSPGEGA